MWCVAKYSKVGAKQPMHDDLTSSGRPTQVVNVVLGPDRILKVKYKDNGFTMKSNWKKDISTCLPIYLINCSNMNISIVQIISTSL